MTPRGIRNNNPGNIIQSSIPWQGKLANPEDSRFEQFDTPLNGIRALCKLLISYEETHGLKTVRGIINRWAPPVENNTSAYVTAIAAAVGVGPDDVISTHGKETLARLCKAIIQHENGQQPYSDELIAQAVRAAGGMPESRPDKPDVTRQASRVTEDYSSGLTRNNARKAMDPLTLVSMLSGVFAPLIRAKLDKALGSDVGKPLADNLLAMAQTATGKTDPLEAVAVARQDPAIVAKLQQASEDWLSQVTPLMDKIDAYERGAWAASEDSLDRAAARGARMQEAGLSRNPQFIVATFIMCMVAGVVFTVLYRDTFSTDMQSFVIGAIVGGALTAVISYFFGTSRSSSAKDATINELAQRR